MDVEIAFRDAGHGDAGCCTGAPVSVGNADAIEASDTAGSPLETVGLSGVCDESLTIGASSKACVSASVVDHEVAFRGAGQGDAGRRTGAPVTVGDAEAVADGDAASSPLHAVRLSGVCDESLAIGSDTEANIGCAVVDVEIAFG